LVIEISNISKGYELLSSFDNSSEVNIRFKVYIPDFPFDVNLIPQTKIRIDSN
jgi:hypothetical protein